MKAPQRRFTVEFKSGRRQPRERKNSIWGDIDLKAFAREVEAVQSFSTNETPAARDTRGNLPSDAGTGSESSANVSAARAVASVGETSIRMPKRHEHPTTRAEVVEHAKETRTVSQTRTRSIRMNVTSRAPHHAITDISKDVGGDQRPHVNAANCTYSLEEFDFLEAENKRLKRMLAEKLQVENMQLRSCLSGMMHVRQPPS